MPSRRAPLAAAVAAAVLSAATGCRPSPAPRPEGTVDPPQVHALLVNGGGTAASNYASHLRHLEEMSDVLAAAAVPPGQTTVLASDGDAPGLDLATREVATDERFWMLTATPADAALRPPLTFVSSALRGLPLRPATREELSAWARRVDGALEPGDTLVVFVTDHGTRNREDPRNNRITLWGEGQSITVRELRALLDHLHPGVRVVTVMSQCFSGSFANLAVPDPPAGPTEVCGYFSTTADRLAYGCYPENRNRDDVGYAFHFARALRRSGDFAEAHRAALVDDASPDVPLRTSDLFLEDALRRAAEAAAADPIVFGDRWLARAFTDRKRWEADLRLLDAIGERYGIFSPRRLAEVQERLTVVPALAGELKTHRDNWNRSRAGATHANWERFAAAHADWPPRLAPAGAPMTPAQRDDLTGDLLGELERFTDRQPGTGERLRSLHERAEEAGTLTYRMETRAGVLLRMQALLFRIAGMEYVRREGSAADRAHLERLLRCERLHLPVTETGAAPQQAREPFPSFEDDVAASQAVVPGWMGVQFRPTSARMRRSLSLGVGAATVQAVYPDSPAKEAGLEPGDVIVGPRGRRFTEPQQLREWVMTAPLGEPVPLDVIRGETPRQVVLRPRAYPRVWPKLPGPPKEGSPAPTLGLTPYRGTPPTSLASGKTTLLFFWATWCGICKAALPDLERAAAENGIEVVSITDEDPEQLDAFFAAYQGPFPGVVAIDENRRSFLDYGVSGTPTFVLVDAAGRVTRQKVGYARAKGLEVLADS